MGNKHQKEEKGIVEEKKDNVFSSKNIIHSPPKEITFSFEEFDPFNNEEDNSENVRLVIIGMGNRGQTYAKYALENPKKCKVVAIVEPKECLRKKFQEIYKLKDEFCFKDWKEITESPNEKIRNVGNAVVICTPDRHHFLPTLAFSKAKYKAILLEKPMAVTLEECEEITNQISINGNIFGVCHILRYFPPLQLIKEMVSNGKIGQMISLTQTEPIGFHHFAHSYVRGNWRRTDTSNFSLMTKSCHDIDYIIDLVGSTVEKVCSFGSLLHFRKDNKPKNSKNEPISCKRCVDCEKEIEEKCPYSALKLYKDRKMGLIHILNANKDDNCEPKDLEDAVNNGPYGKFHNGVSASFTMVATSLSMCQRKISIYGSLGEIQMDWKKIVLSEYPTGKTTEHDVMEIAGVFTISSSLEGHNFADYHLMKSFVNSVSHNDQKLLKTDGKTTLYSHKIVFQAEKSRLEERVLKLDENGNEINKKKTSVEN